MEDFAIAMNGIQYSCPGHTHIKQNEPGQCPICGRSLEPEVPAEIQNL